MQLNVYNIIIVPWTPSHGRNMLEHLRNYLSRLNPEYFWTRLCFNTLYHLSRPMVYRLDGLLSDAKRIHKLLSLGFGWLTILSYGDPIEKALTMDANLICTGDLSDADGVINSTLLV